jgi:hypothetical protein
MKRAWTVLSGCLLVPLLYSGNDHPSQLEQVQQRGSMTLLTRTLNVTILARKDQPGLNMNWYGN